MAITILVKNPNATHEGCKIQYRDIGDYLSREEKLEALSEAESIKGVSNWQTITPDKHYDWIHQRSEVFAKFYPLGSDEARTGKVDDTIFRLYSRGVNTGRSAYIYNFSRNACAENAQQMTQCYLAALAEIKHILKPTKNRVKEVAARRSSHLKWDDDLRNNLQRKKETLFDKDYVRKVSHRPFVNINCYADNTFIQRKYQMDRIFPDSDSENRVICVPGIGNKIDFSVLMTDTMPDLGFIAACQCFPRWQYPKPPDPQNATGTFDGIDDPPDRIDNISDTVLQAFRYRYRNDTISKDDIFDYIYGILHLPSYQQQFKYDFWKMLPRIPYAPDFRAFAEAGAALADLHLNYETCEQYPLELIFAHDGEPQPHHFQLTNRAMRFADDEKTTLIINDHIRLSGIPKEAHRYVVNGRTPLEWFIDRYKITQDKDSGIINDPNGWFDNPRDFITAIQRIVHVSVESSKIIENLSSDVISDETEIPDPYRPEKVGRSETRPRVKLADLLEHESDDLASEEVDTGPQVGKEVW